MGALGEEDKGSGREQKWSLAAWEKKCPFGQWRQGAKELSSPGNRGREAGDGVPILTLLLALWPWANCLPGSNFHSLKIGGK